MDINSALMLIISGAIAPFLTALFTTPNMNPNHKRIILVCVAVGQGIVLGVGSGVIEGVPGGIADMVKHVVIAIAVIVGLAQGMYETLKPLVKGLEEVTSESPRRAVDDNPYK